MFTTEVISHHRRRRGGTPGSWTTMKEDEGGRRRTSVVCLIRPDRDKQQTESQQDTNKPILYPVIDELFTGDEQHRCDSSCVVALMRWFG